jgi:hypothetical protein
MSTSLLASLNILQPKAPLPEAVICKTFETPVDAKKAIAMILDGSAPDGLRVDGALNLANNSKLQSLPAGLSAGSLKRAPNRIRIVSAKRLAASSLPCRK